METTENLGTYTVLDAMQVVYNDRQNPDRMLVLRRKEWQPGEYAWFDGVGGEWRMWSGVGRNRHAYLFNPTSYYLQHEDWEVVDAATQRIIMPITEPAVQQEALALLRQFVRVSESEAFRAWEGAALQTHLRAEGFATKGYQGEKLPVEEAKAFLASVDPEDRYAI